MENNKNLQERPEEKDLRENTSTTTQQTDPGRAETEKPDKEDESAMDFAPGSDGGSDTDGGID